MLVVALLAIAASVALPEISFNIRRDREQEMVHRGVQYSRAIRAYFKKYGRYPTRLDDLDNTNNLRYLRKHYKDPVTGQDFRLLHYGEQGVTLAGGFGGAAIAGASASGSGGLLNSSSAFSQPSPSGNANSAFGGNANSAFGGNANNSFGANSANSNSATGPNSAAPNPATGTDPSQSSASANSEDSTSKSGSSDQSSSNQLGASGPIVGVASTSKKTTIREFNKKKKYNEWQFVYDPTMDRGGLITTPYQPSLQGFGISQGSVAPQQGSSSSSPFGQPAGAGNPSGFGNQSSSFGNSGSNAPASPPPSNPPPQQ